MGVLLANGDITIFRLNKKTQTYSRINIPDVNINYKRNASIDNKEINIKYSVKIILNADNTVLEGDKIVLGNINQDIEKLAQLSEYGQIITVVSVQKNHLFNSLILECI